MDVGVPSVNYYLSRRADMLSRPIRRCGEGRGERGVPAWSTVVYPLRPGFEAARAHR